MPLTKAEQRAAQEERRRTIIRMVRLDPSVTENEIRAELGFSCHKLTIIRDIRAMIELGTLIETHDGENPWAERRFAVMKDGVQQRHPDTGELLWRYQRFYHPRRLYVASDLEDIGRE